MFRKNYISLFLFIALIAVGSVVAAAQKPVGGKIELEDEKGKKAPHQGAKIDCYRVDVTESCGSTTSDEKGLFSFDGIPKEAVLVMALSGTGLAQAVVADVTLDEKNVFVVKAGEGFVPTEEAVRLVAIEYAKDNNKLTDAQKAELADYEKKIADKAAQAERATVNNKLRDQYLKEGNAAYSSKDYDLAIEKFTLGYELDRKFLGSAPVFLKNKAESLWIRAADNFNTAVKSKDRAAISKAKADAITDFTEALNATTKSYELTSKGQSDKNTSAKKIKEDTEDARTIIKKIYKTMGQMKVNLASTLATAEDASKAVSIYQISLGIIPDDPDILAGLALALYSAGDFKGSVEDKRESLGYWNKYKKVAPKDHEQQAVADGMIEFLEEEVK